MSGTPLFMAWVYFQKAAGLELNNLLIKNLRVLSAEKLTSQLEILKSFCISFAHSSHPTIAEAVLKTYTELSKLLFIVQELWVILSPVRM